MSQLSSETTKRCPYCAETIKAEAVVCRYCGYDLPGATPTAAPPAVAARATVEQDVSSYRGRVLLGSGLIIIGSFLPWFVMTDGYNNQMTMSGLEGDGVYTIILGFLALGAAVSIKYKADKNVSGGGAIFGGLAGLIAIYDIFYSYGLLEEAGNRFSLSVQWGLPLIILGGGLALFTGLAKFPE